MGRRQHHRTHPQRAKPLHSVAEHDDRKQGIREKDGKDTQLCATHTGQGAVSSRHHSADACTARRTRNLSTRGMARCSVRTRV